MQTVYGFASLPDPKTHSGGGDGFAALFHGGAIMTVPQKERIKALRGQGLSYQEIAGKVGVSRNTVKTYCHRNALEAVTASEETKQKEIKDQCAHCGQALQKTRSTKKFCSDACRMAYHKANRPHDAICAHCGGRFNDIGNRKRKYCSIKCCTASRFPVRSAGEVAV